MFVTTFETSIEIDNAGNIYSDFSEKEAKDHLRFFVQLIEEEDIRYFPMNEGMVNFSNKDIVISFRVEVLVKTKSGYFLLKISKKIFKSKKIC